MKRKRQERKENKGEERREKGSKREEGKGTLASVRAKDKVRGNKNRARVKRDGEK